MARLSPEYHRYHASPAWAEAKRRHWEHPLTLKSCVVCGARRGERPLDHHELLYRTAGRGRDRVMLDPPWWGIVPACAYPCHRLLITPLSRAPYVRAALFTVLAAAALWAGAPVLPTAGVTAGALALPRIPEATFLAAVLGLPVRLVRAVGRLAR
ncbi:hypothetical protein [Frankia sp. Cj3]|uniref:hypothetical protein n=1 Tax=Frankia sp. Cj3 TaxID=2880976 RepID=UPI001EF6159C|nr:hypothetical protein [Frankia sp. Cj3]